MHATGPPICLFVLFLIRRCPCLIHSISPHNRATPVTLNWLVYEDPWIWLQPDSPQVRALVMHELGHNYEPAGERFEPPGAEEAFADLIQYGWQSARGLLVSGITHNLAAVQG